jgi:hypothetical protein
LFGEFFAPEAGCSPMAGYIDGALTLTMSAHKFAEKPSLTHIDHDSHYNRITATLVTS